MQRSNRVLVRRRPLIARSMQSSSRLLFVVESSASSTCDWMSSERPSKPLNESKAERGRVERRLDDEEVDGGQDRHRGDDLDDRVDDCAGAKHRDGATLAEQQVVGEVAAALHRRRLEPGVLDAVAHPLGRGRRRPGRRGCRRRRARSCGRTGPSCTSVWPSSAQPPSRVRLSPAAFTQPLISRAAAGQVPWRLARTTRRESAAALSCGVLGCALVWRRTLRIAR